MKKKVLTDKQIEYISSAFDLMFDHIKEDIQTLSRGTEASQEMWMWEWLSPVGRAGLDITMAFQFLTTLITLVYKFHNEKTFLLGNRAEEILLYIALEHAAEFENENEPEIEAYDYFMDTCYEDTDFLFLYDLTYDGIDESTVGEKMGIGSLSLKDWFTPFTKPRRPHPFFWPEKERLQFPANRDIEIFDGGEEKGI